jgi:hypothetical protein
MESQPVILKCDWILPTIKIFHYATSKLISFLFFWIAASINLTLGNDGNDTIICNHCLDSICNASVPLCSDCTALCTPRIWKISIMSCQDQIQKSLTFCITSVNRVFQLSLIVIGQTHPSAWWQLKLGMKARATLSRVCCLHSFQST